MKFKLLGRSGLRVSELALGAMTFGQDWGWGADLAEAVSAIELGFPHDFLARPLTRSVMFGEIEAPTRD